MKKDPTNSVQGKDLLRVAFVTGLLLLIPLMAMQFNWQVHDPGSTTQEGVNWDWLDFVVMGILLFSAGSAYVVAAKKTGNRIVTAFVVGAIFFLLWAELAVGIFNSPFAGS